MRSTRGMDGRESDEKTAVSSPKKADEEEWTDGREIKGSREALRGRIRYRRLGGAVVIEFTELVAAKMEPVPGALAAGACVPELSDRIDCRWDG